MKILFFPRLYYPHIGGVEKHVSEISRELIKDGHTVSVLTENHGWEEQEEKDSVLIRRIETGKDDWWKKFRIWGEIWKQRSLIQEADVIHCHDVFFWYLPFRFLFPSKRVYITFHGYEGFPVKKKAVLMRKLCEKLAMGNICIGAFIEKWYGTKADYISYGGVTISKEEKKYKNNAAVFIGRLDKDTGIQIYLKAYKLLKKIYPDFSLTVVGDGTMKQENNSLIRYVGFKQNIESYLQDAHFAFVSGYLSMLEAMAAKRPVFAVYDNVLKEDYLKMTPFAKYISMVNSPQQLVDAIKRYKESPDEEQEKIEKAYQWAKKQTWKSLTDQYLHLWNV